MSIFKRKDEAKKQEQHLDETRIRQLRIEGAQRAGRTIERVRTELEEGPRRTQTLLLELAKASSSQLDPAHLEGEHAERDHGEKWTLATAAMHEGATKLQVIHALARNHFTEETELNNELLYSEERIRETLKDEDRGESFLEEALTPRDRELVEELY